MPPPTRPSTQMRASELAPAPATLDPPPDKTNSKKKRECLEGNCMPFSNQRIFTIPNVITFLRFGLVLTMIVLAWCGAAKGFLCSLVSCILTDVIDGYLARRLNQVTELGTLLDSVADLAMFSCLPVCAWLLWPDIVRRESGYLLVALASYAIPIALGFLKYGRLTAYHTRGGKLSVGLMGGTPLILFLGGPAWPFHIATGFFVMAELEEIAITVLLPTWRANVPSLWHALRLRKGAPNSSTAR